MHQTPKHIPLSEAAALVQDNDTLALGGMTLYRRPTAFVRALLHRHRARGAPANLTLLGLTGGFEGDLLIGAGLARRVRTCYFGLEIFGLAPMFTYYANRGELEIIEETEASLAFGLRAQLAGVGFMPARAWLGTDLPALRPDVKTVTDPYSGETLMAFPAIHPDIAVIHALKADEDGNALLGGNQAMDAELALAAKTIIVTAEEIVPALEKADLAASVVDYIVHAPRGAAPASCYPLYPLDGETLLRYTEQAASPEGFLAVLDSFLS
ncbi:MAG: CoA transferase subunit A [Anaerolineales bacterium]